MAMNLHVIPLSCEYDWESLDNVKIIPNRSVRFYEDFSGDISRKYFFSYPVDFTGQMPEWRYLRNNFEKTGVIEQKSRTDDSNQDDKEHAVAIIKNGYFNSEAYYSLEFYVFYEGVIGIIFKYKDKDNYYLFEIGGGHNVSKKFFSVRKKLNGKWSEVQTIQNVQELSYLPFFGYDLKTWYTVDIVANLKGQIDIKIGIVNHTLTYQIMNVDTSDIEYGYAGFSTRGTKALFTNIGIRPMNIPMSNFSTKYIGRETIPDDLYNDDDVILLHFFDPNHHLVETNKTHDEEIESYKTTYEVCAVNKTPDQRNKYCKREYGISRIAQKRCEGDYCRTCCYKNSPNKNKVVFHNCIKECNRSYTPSEDEEWKTICVNPPPGKITVYFACEQDFPKNKKAINTCKLDHCRLCCSTYELAIEKDVTLNANNKCFEGCRDKFENEDEKIYSNKSKKEQDNLINAMSGDDDQIND